MTRNLQLITASAAAVAALATCAASAAPGRGDRLPIGSEPVKLDPDDFSTTIDNPYLPMTRGDRRVYRKTSIDGRVQRVVEVVTNQTRLVAGIEARVVHVVDYVRGKLEEETFDWYAQDKAGNVWYLGEDTTYFKNGRVFPRKDSWESGVNGAYPGVVMPARPRIGLRYRQEYAKGIARDRAEVLARSQQAETPLRHYQDAWLIAESTPLEPTHVDLHFYARGVGRVLAVEVSGGDERTELVKFRPGRSRSAPR
jgi:hypothetical protein